MKIPVTLLVFSVLYTAIILISSSLPMFWDMGYVVRISNLIYDHHFSTVIFASADNGTPPLYSFYLACIWVMTGKSLFVCHLAILPFMLAMLYQFYRFALRFVNSGKIYFAFILLLIEPTMATQAVLAGYDIVFCFLFLFALNSIFENKRWWLALSTLFIPLLSSRGFSYVVALLLTDILINRSKYKNVKFFFRNIIPYLPAFFLCCGWLIWHYLITGWFAVSEGRETFHHVRSFEGILRNIFYAIWKIADFGRVILYVYLAFILFKIWKAKDVAGKKLFLILFFTVLPYLIFFTPLSYPVSHRYFMVTNIIAIILFIDTISFIRFKALRIAVSLVVVLSLLAGNFIQYPERFGNGWDSSLKVLPYFKLKEKFDDYIKSSPINPADIGAEFPLNFDNYNCDPASSHFAFTDLDTKPFNTFPYIVQSNICNTFTPAEITALNTRWQLVKELRTCQIYIRLFKNPGKPE